MRNRWDIILFPIEKGKGTTDISDLLSDTLPQTQWAQKKPRTCIFPISLLGRDSFPRPHEKFRILLTTRKMAINNEIVSIQIFVLEYRVWVFSTMSLYATSTRTWSENSNYVPRFRHHFYWFTYTVLYVGRESPCFSMNAIHTWLLSLNKRISKWTISISDAKFMVIDLIVCHHMLNFNFAPEILGTRILDWWIIHRSK